MHKQIQINQKLMEREDRLVEIFDLERQIHSILGGEPYPLAASDDLPSRQKRKNPKRKAAPKKPAALRVRALDLVTEKAYRIIYLQDNEEISELHFDFKPLALLLNTPLPRTKILRLETICQTEDGQLEAVELLYSDRPE